MQSKFLVLALCKTVISDHDDALNMIACNKKTLYVISDPLCSEQVKMKA